MGLFEHFPFTNFHQLNLDWVIQEIKNLENHAVLSVNGQTGDVILYQSENVVFPDVESSTWRMVRTADGHTAGIMFQNGLAYVMFDSAAERIYTVDHPPAYPVTSVNGQTGDVTTYNHAYNRLPAVSEQNTNFYRTVDKDGTPVDVGIQVDKTKIERMNGSNRYKVYDEQNTPPYPVTSVNGQTGAVILAIPFDDVSDSVMMATEASEDHTAGFARETVDGTVSIYTVTTGTDATAYLHFVSSDDQYSYTRKLLTLDDIPSSSGVVSLNGLTGVVTITGDNLYLDSNESITIDNALEKLHNDLAVLVKGNTATVNVETGMYVVVLESTITGISDGFYLVLNNVSANTPFTVNDLSAVNNGLANEIGHVNTIPISFSSSDTRLITASTNVTCYKCGKLCQLYVTSRWDFSNTPFDVGDNITINLVGNPVPITLQSVISFHSTRIMEGTINGNTITIRNLTTQNNSGNAPIALTFTYMTV